VTDRRAVESSMNTWRRARLLGALTLAVALAACGSPGSIDSSAASVGPNATLSTLRSTFSPCPAAMDGEPSTSVQEFLGSAQTWVRIKSVLKANRRGKGADAFGSADVMALDGAKRTITVHSSFWPGIDWGLRNGADVAVAVAPAGQYDMTNAVLAATVSVPGRGVVFVGACQEKALGAPLRKNLGTAYTRTLTALPDLSQTAGAKALGGKPATAQLAATPKPRILNPEDASATLLASLQPVAVHLVLTRALGPSYTVCTHIAEGWGDCIPADEGSVTSGYTVNSYLGSGRTMEVWLMDENADVTKPIRKLGAVTFGSSLAKARDVVASIEVDTRGTGEGEVSTMSAGKGVDLVAQFDGRKAPADWER
jgi:hypothetical protein